MTRHRNRLAGLYALADTQVIPAGQLPAAAAAVLAGGARVIQYRDKSAGGSRLEQARALKALCMQHDALFIVNDDVALANASGADGVHLGKDDDSFDAARHELAEHMVIGVSCYDSLERALEAQAAGADYVAFGSFFSSRVKPDAVRATLELLRTARQRISVPICAIGGITLDNAAPLLDNGADMLAVISALFTTNNPGQAARELAALFERD